MVEQNIVVLNYALALVSLSTFYTESVWFCGLRSLIVVVVLVKCWQTHHYELITYAYSEWFTAGPLIQQVPLLQPTSCSLLSWSPYSEAVIIRCPPHWNCFLASAFYFYSSSQILRHRCPVNVKGGHYQPNSSSRAWHGGSLNIRPPTDRINKNHNIGTKRTSIEEVFFKYIFVNTLVNIIKIRSGPSRLEIYGAADCRPG